MSNQFRLSRDALSRSGAARTRSQIATAAALCSLLLVPVQASAQRPAKLSARTELSKRWHVRAAATARLMMPNVSEHEPNNTPGTANPVALGDVVSGAFSSTSDLDIYVVDVPANAILEVDVASARNGVQTDAYIDLLDAVTGTYVASADDDVGLDPVLRYVRSTASRYYIIVGTAFGGGPNSSYEMSVRLVPTGPGDPTTVFANNLGAPWATVAQPGNTFYVLDVNGRILRVGATGQVTVVANVPGEAYSLAVDGFGNILVGEYRSGIGADIVRYTPSGQRSIFIEGIEGVSAIEIAPNGDVYVGDPDAGQVRWYSPAGALLGSINIRQGAVEEISLMDLAFSPSGALHISDFGNTVYRVVNNSLQVVLKTSYILGGIAFDRDGYMYTGSFGFGIHLFDPTYHAVNSPFAVANTSMTGNVVFGRDDSGAMTNRLFGINVGDGRMIEVARSGVRAPGLRVGADLLVVANASLRNGVMGAAYADTLRIENAPAGATWRISAGALPSGVTLGVTGVLSGTPAASGAFSFTAAAELGSRVGSKAFTITVTRPQVNASIAADALLGLPGSISADVARFLDLQGNNNGRFDVGDLQAYLRATANVNSIHQEKR